jgi:hypothetical protein
MSRHGPQLNPLAAPEPPPAHAAAHEDGWATFAPGTSPFRIKGNALLGYLRFCDEFVPGGREAVWNRLRTPALEAFFAQRFVVGGWYDVLPIVPLVRSMALLLETPLHEVLRRHATAQAELDISTIYKMMLKLASPGQVVKALPGTAKRYFDFVRSEVQELAPRRWEVTIHGVPAPVLVIYKIATEAFIVRALELAGARGLRHRWLTQYPAGEVQGIPILRLRRELSWDV